MKDPHRYDDMLVMPHHQSKIHPPMSLSNRAAQFSPFAALTGYEQVIAETARLTQHRTELDENAKSLLDEKFLMIMDRTNNHQEMEFTYFVPDLLKDGGSYQTICGIVKKVDMIYREITLSVPSDSSVSQVILKMDDIVDIQGISLYDQ